MVFSGSSIVRFYDRTTVYFGDYHRVRLEAICEFVDTDRLSLEEDGIAGATSLNTPTVYTRILEKMAVPSASLESVKTALIEDFRINTLPYLLSPEFPSKLLSMSILAKSVTARKYPASSM